jgi:benzoyl-CoA reductase/2-hydroxyglutaryl-CoA dehydratase subunit BcrC/BadD/HgdB
MRDRVGFTTSVPIEILFGAGLIPCDLNNLFITDPSPQRLVERAEADGFPKNLCNWIKGIYGAVVTEGVKTVVCVMEGDCSNTRALAEILTYKGVRIVPFSYPYDRDRASLQHEIEKFRDAFQADSQDVQEIEKALEKVRRNLVEIDRMTWEDGLVSGKENNAWLLSSSDMEGDYDRYEKESSEFVVQARGREKLAGLRIGYVGVPTITLDLYDFLESLGCQVVYNEVQRQFSLPYFSCDLTDRYLHYTYPYGIFPRMEDIKTEISRRGIEGIVHYVQAFCYRVVEDVIMREMLGVPVLTIEGDLPRALDSRTKLRLEAFAEMLKSKGQ